MDYISLFKTTSQSIPEGITWMEAAQELADFLSSDQALDDEAKAMLVGIGAMMYRQAQMDAQADLETKAVFRHIKGL